MKSIFSTIAMLALCNQTAQAAPLYKIVDLGAVTGPNAGPAAIDDEVEIPINSGGKVSIWWPGGGKYVADGVAYDVNRGILVGQFANGLPLKAGYWYNSGPTKILSVGGGFGTAYSINSQGEAFGYIRGGGGYHLLYEWDGFNGTWVGSLVADGLGVNDLGQRVGLNRTTNGGFYNNGNDTKLLPIPLIPTDLNNHRLISGAAGGLAAIYDYDTATLTTVGKLNPGDADSSLLRVNDHGLAGGYSGSTGVLWSSSTGLIDANSVLAPQFGDWHLQTVTGVNNRDQFVGVALVDGQTHAYFAVPLPEPSTWLLGLTAAGGLLSQVGRSRRRMQSPPAR